MFFQKDGYPEVSEIVLCSVTKIHSHGVFVDLDEYPQKKGMIHISEIAPGRIRNIRDYVKMDKKVVCKVLHISLERGHIDLSLRRVNENQRRLKIEELKQEQVAEKIIETIAKRLKREPADLYKEVAPPCLKAYGMVHSCFSEVVESKLSLASLGIPPEAAAGLEEEIRARISIPEVLIEGTLKVVTFAPDGVEIVRQGLAMLPGLASGEVSLALSYPASGKYRLAVTAPDYKQAEAVLKDATDNITAHMKERGGTAEFKRRE